jgi:hypothetical protein
MGDRGNEAGDPDKEIFYGIEIGGYWMVKIVLRVILLILLI